jgi:hypothetical protein
MNMRHFRINSLRLHRRRACFAQAGSPGGTLGNLLTVEIRWAFAATEGVMPDSRVHCHTSRLDSVTLLQTFLLLLFNNNVLKLS